MDLCNKDPIFADSPVQRMLTQAINCWVKKKHRQSSNVDQDQLATILNNEACSMMSSI